MKEKGEKKEKEEKEKKKGGKKGKKKRKSGEKKQKRGEKNRKKNEAEGKKWRKTDQIQIPSFEPSLLTGDSQLQQYQLQAQGLWYNIFNSRRQHY